MAVVRHCRHCWGDCSGGCLLDDDGMCIHNAYVRLVRRRRPRVLSPAWLRMLFRSARQQADQGHRPGRSGGQELGCSPPRH
jgi:hypothetical protein